MTLSMFLMVGENRSAGWLDGNPDVTTDKQTYIVGEAVHVNVTCWMGAVFTSGKQCYFVVEDSLDKEVYNMSMHYYWIQVFTSLHPPKTFAFTWDQKDDAGVQVPVGDYEVWGYEAGYRMSDAPIAGNSTAIAIKDNSASTQGVERFDVPLLQGWNLFSLPLVASNYTAGSLGLPSGSIVVRWNSSRAAYDGTYIVGSSPPSFAFPVVEGMGYWVFTPSACNVSIFGQTLTTTHYYEYIVPVGGGWVLLGFPKTGGVNFYPASVVVTWGNIPQGITIVVMYVAGTATYTVYIAGLPMNDFRILPGVGYWAWISQSLIVAYG